MEEINNGCQKTKANIASAESKLQLYTKSLPDNININNSESKLSSHVSDTENLADLRGNSDDHVAPPVGTTKPDTDVDEVNKCLLSSTPEVNKMEESKLADELKQTDFHDPHECCETGILAVEKSNVQSPWDMDNKKENVTSVRSGTTVCDGNISFEGLDIRQDGLVKMCSSPARENTQPIDYTLPLGGSTSTSTQIVTNASYTPPSTLQDMTTLSTSPDAPSYNTAISFSLNPNVTISIPESPKCNKYTNGESFLSHDNHCKTLETNTSLKCIKLDFKVQSETTKIRQSSSDDTLQSLPPCVTLSLPPDVTLSDAESKGPKDTTPLENITAITKFYLDEDEVQSSPADAASHVPSSNGESQTSFIVQTPGRMETKASVKTENRCETLNDKDVQCSLTEVVFHEYVTVHEMQPMTETNVYRIINKYNNSITDQGCKTEVTPNLCAEMSNDRSTQRKETKIYKAETQVPAYIEVPLKIEELLGEYWKENTAPCLFDEAATIRQCSTTEIYKDDKFELEIPAVVIENCQLNGNKEDQSSPNEGSRHGLITETEPTKDISLDDNIPVERTFEVQSETNNRNKKPSTDAGMNHESTDKGHTLNSVSRSTREKANTKKHDSAALEKGLAAMKRLQVLMQGENCQEIAGNENLFDATTNISKLDMNQFRCAGVRSLGKLEESCDIFHKSTIRHAGKGCLPQGKRIPAIKRLEMLIHDT